MNSRRFAQSVTYFPISNRSAFALSAFSILAIYAFLADVTSRLKSSVELQADILAELTDRKTEDILEKVDERRREYLTKEADRFLKLMGFSQEYRADMAERVRKGIDTDKKYRSLNCPPMIPKKSA